MCVAILTLLDYPLAHARGQRYQVLADSGSADSGSFVVLSTAAETSYTVTNYADFIYKLALRVSGIIRLCITSR